MIYAACARLLPLPLRALKPIFTGQSETTPSFILSRVGAHVKLGQGLNKAPPPPHPAPKWPDTARAPGSRSFFSRGQFSVGPRAKRRRKSWPAGAPSLPRPRRNMHRLLFGPIGEPVSAPRSPARTSSARAPPDTGPWGC